MHIPYFLNNGLLLSLIVLVISLESCQPAETTQQAPNIVYILADDLGYGDLSCNNSDSKLHTEALDQLAASGMRFTDAHSNSAVCSPTRYGILTGRYAWRTSLSNGVTWSNSPPLINKDRMTVASLLKGQGYQTACIGKWHLGLGWDRDSNDVIDYTLPLKEGPNDLGFDYFYGITASLDIPPYFYIENDRITATSVDSTDGRSGQEFWRPGPVGNDFDFWEVLPTLTKKAKAFIQQESQSENPFFLYFPLPAPHTPILPTKAFQGKSQTNPYGDFVLMVDDVVRQIVGTLEENDIRENTLIIFTSDNGCSPMANFEALDSLGHDPSGPFRGHKADIFEGGHRVPFIASWPGNIPAGKVSPQLVSLTDLMATCAAMHQLELPEDAGEDSYSILETLLDQPTTQPRRRNMVQHSINGSFALRSEQWKLAFCPGSGGWSDPRPAKAIELGLPDVQLFDLEKDTAEMTNVWASNPAIIQSFRDTLMRYIETGRSTPGDEVKNDEGFVMPEVKGIR